MPAKQTSKATPAPKRFAVGDHVGWNSEAGHVSGTIIKEIWPRLFRQRFEESKWITAGYAASCCGSELKYTVSGVWPSSDACGRRVL